MFEATMTTYSGMTYNIGQGSLDDCRNAVKAFLKKREKTNTGEVAWLSPYYIECEDDGYRISDLDGAIRITKI